MDTGVRWLFAVFVVDAVVFLSPFSLFDVVVFVTMVLVTCTQCMFMYVQFHVSISCRMLTCLVKSINLESSFSHILPAFPSFRCDFS